MFPVLHSLPSISSRAAVCFCSVHVHHDQYPMTGVSSPSNRRWRSAKPMSRHPLVTQLLAGLTYTWVISGLREVMVNGAAGLLPSRYTCCSEVPYLLFDSQWIFSVYLITIKQSILSKPFFHAYFLFLIQDLFLCLGKYHYDYPTAFLV